jgi:hypothetical protein
MVTGFAPGVTEPGSGWMPFEQQGGTAFRVHAD